MNFDPNARQARLSAWANGVRLKKEVAPPKGLL
jgi:hypothetical protein